MSERARVTVRVQITTDVEITDTGYLGTQASVEEHIDKARKDVSHWQVLIKQGGLEPKPARASFVVQSVQIVPHA